MFMHTSIFSAWGEGAVEYFEFGGLPKSHNTLSSKRWRHNDIKYASSSSKMLAVGGLIYQHFWTRKKIEFFNFLIGAQIAYKINPINFYKEWWNRNTVKILFCIVKFVKF